VGIAAARPEKIATRIAAFILTFERLGTAVG
jgi:hypothetical protein